VNRRVSTTAPSLGWGYSWSESNKIVAKTAVNAFGGTPRVTRFWDDDHVSSVDILSCEDGPQKGVTAYPTIGLSDWPLYHGDR
jgi:hypothetical protein